MKVAFLAAAVLATAGVAFYFGTALHAAKASGPESAEQGSAERSSAAHKALSSKSLSLPLFFEPNQGQTAPQVKFLAHGAGYGLFLTADEAVLNLQRAAVKGKPSSSSVIRMRLDGASSAARVSGTQPLPGKSSYFIGKDPSQWHRDIPQFAGVEYQSVYPGIDMVYHGDQGQLEYDFRVAPGAEPRQIALSFTGASAHIDSGNSNSNDAGDLILATANGDVRFHAPRVYQPAAPESGNAEKAIPASFRQLADNKIGFTIGDYDHNRELVIDPILTYSTYLGGTGSEGSVQVAVDSALNIYLAGSTNSTYFFPPPAVGGSPPYQNALNGAQNIFIAKINPLNAGTGTSQLVYATYLGSTGTDSLAGIAVDSNYSIYVAGTTTSSDSSFPITSSNAFQTAPAAAGTHGFLSKISLTGPPASLVYNLTYSTYLAGTNEAGNAVDTVTGLAIDGNQNAYVTGDTTSDNPCSVGFPANCDGFQTTSNNPGNAQIFASKINTNGSGIQSMLYSTYFGGGYPATATATGGGIAVDPAGTYVNMYITGTTNMLGLTPNGQPPFPLYNAQQTCLNLASTTNCGLQNPTTTPDAFVAKINPNQQTGGFGAPPVYSTYLGAEGNDTGIGIAVDTSGNAYVVGSTNSSEWVCSACPGGFQPGLITGATNGFMVKIGNTSGTTSVPPLTYFTYLGGSGTDSAQAIQVDSLQAAHVAGSTTSGNLPTDNAIQPSPSSPYEGNQLGGPGDAFVALISTTLSGQGAGDYLTYLGGSQLDVGSGIALDTYNATYVAGSTQSSDFPVTAATAYQTQLPGTPAAFVSKLGAYSQLAVTNPNTSPSPFPVAAGTQVAFTFDVTNQGPDNATNVTFYATVPTSGLATPPTAKVISGSGSCGQVSGSTIPCNIPTLAPCTGTCTVGAAIEVDVTPSITDTNNTVTVSGSALANGGSTQVSNHQQAPVVNFSVTAYTSTPVINAGDTATFPVKFCPTNPQYGYNATITPSQTTSPSMVTATTPTFNPTTVTLSGFSCGTTTLSIATVARPVATGGLFRRGSFYAAWLPIGGLSMVGLGIGVGRKRRRWLVGAVLGLIAGVILLQPGCGSSTSSTTTPGGTQPALYTITIEGSGGAGASQSNQVYLTVN